MEDDSMSTLLDVTRILSGSELFAPLGEEEIARLADQVRIIRYEKSLTLYSPHDQCRVITLVAEGMLEIVRDLPSGDSAVLRQVFPCQTIGEAACATGSRYPGWVRTSLPSAVIEIPYESILMLCGSPLFLNRYLHGLGLRMQIMLEHVACLSSRTLRRKVACYLLNRGDRDHMSVTRMADYLGSSRESVSRVLSGLIRERLIVREGGSIRILDRESLELVRYGT
jgi:CRP-like cAMP-binding protein